MSCQTLCYIAGYATIVKSNLIEDNVIVGGKPQAGDLRHIQATR